MRITFELEPDDVARFHAALARARQLTQCADEVDVIDAAKYALDHMCAGAAPAYVRKRLVEVQRLILMLEDEAWALSEPERSDVIETLAYFSDPDDLIPDDVEVIGNVIDGRDARVNALGGAIATGVFDRGRDGGGLEIDCLDPHCSERSRGDRQDTTSATEIEHGRRI